ncbi:LysR family transcriptional regulator [Duganella sp. Leaf126]|uniref:LysR family transcriptional regulator n=1 Tax=Duganella sp. Leaf126 TaxID=1736266 RepID=UPI0006F8F87A|nr:LysR family transcriptional regulator [Duganella sp. Leaf126]KQQ33387.1 LysR family transcriptional regulator [Duganella sp. Leaf126]
MTDLRQLDLNLLVTLDVLLAEHNVTRAARRLHLSQPSVSVHLARLREMFGDPLLLPGPRGMRPTARGESLREPLRLALEALGQAVAPASAFDPAVATQTWRVAATDYGESTIVLPALASLRQQAPATRLAVLELAPDRITRQAEQGEIDLAFHTSAGAPPGLRRRTLFAERYVLAGRMDHPRLQRKPTLKQFCTLEHVLVSNSGGFYGVTDEVLAQAGLSRRVALSVPHFLFMIAALAATDLVALVPERLVRGNRALTTVAPPVAVPGYEMAMLWHERAHRDPAHQWLRAQVQHAVMPVS